MIVCESVWVNVGVRVCECERIWVCVSASRFAWVNVGVQVCECERIWVYVNASRCAWVIVGMWVSVWACVSVCLCTSMCEWMWMYWWVWVCMRYGGNGRFVGTCLPVRAKYPYLGALEQSCGCCKQVLGLSYRFCLSPVPATSKSTLCYHVTIYLAGLSVSLLSPAVLKHSDPKWLGEVDANLFLRWECIGGGWCWGRNWGRNHGGCCLLARSQLLLS